MDSVMGNRFVFFTLMIMVSLFAVGKVALPLLQMKKTVLITDEQLLSDIPVYTASIPGDAVAPVVEAMTEVADWKSNWSASDLIPSAEAAEAIALEEESYGSGAGTQASDVLEVRERKKELLAMEKALNDKELEINDATLRAEEKIKELLALEARIQAMLDEEKSIKDKKIKRLVAVYEGMKAERAAPVIAEMDLGIVVKIFSSMNEKQVGKILSFLPPQKAVVISQALTKRLNSLNR